LKKSFERFTGGRDLRDTLPNQLPGDVTTKVPFSKFGAGFNVRFHGGDEFPLAVKSAQPSPDELAYLRPGHEPSISVNRAADIEFMLRKNVRVLSSLDWLLNTMKEVTSLPNQDPSVVEALWFQIRKTLAFSTDFSSGALVSLLVLRREAFLKGCDTMKVPRRTHTWATLRPPFVADSPSLLADTASVLRKEAKEDREVALMSSLTAQRSTQSFKPSTKPRVTTASHVTAVTTASRVQPAAPAPVSSSSSRSSSRNYRGSNKRSYRNYQTRR
jgi:hypothetical protein